MPKKKKKSAKPKRKKQFKRKSNKRFKKLKIKKRKKKSAKSRKRKKQFKRKSNKRFKKLKIKKRKKKSAKSRKRKKVKSTKIKRSSKSIILKIIRLQDRLTPKFNFNFNLDKAIQRFFQKIADKIDEYKAIKAKEDERKRIEKVKEMQKEKAETIKKVKLEKQLALEEKQRELREEIKLEKERKKDIYRFIKFDQALLRKERAEKQRKFLEQIKLEKKIEQFRKREDLELFQLNKYVLSQERQSYSEIEFRIQKIKDKYKALRDAKIKQRVEELGIAVEEGDDRSVLLEKERQYNLEREKIESALESYARCCSSAVYSLNKSWIPRYLSILRVKNLAFETGEIFIKWDESPDQEWLMLIYIRDNNPDSGIVVEDKTNPEKNISIEYRPQDIFKFTNFLADSLTNLLDREIKKRKNT